MAKKPNLNVDGFMDELDHPLKAEVQVLRGIIKGVNPAITEEVKWKAPSYSYKGYMVTFNLWQTGFVQLIFHNGAILDDQNGLLTGSYPDRRLVAINDMADVKAKQPALERAIREWIERMDNDSP